MTIVAVFLTFLQVGVVFAWFAVGNTVEASLGSFTVVNSESWSFSDGAYYRFKSQPFSASSTQIYLDSYDYVIAENNSNNNIFVVFEVEVLTDDTNYTFKLLTDEDQLLTKQYKPCDVVNAMVSVRGAPEYLINKIGYSVYYFDQATQLYVLCEDFDQISYSNGAYVYGTAPCYYSTYFLSDCLTVEFCTPNITSIPELQSKTAAGNLTGLSDLFLSLSSYYSNGGYTSDSFVNTALWTKKTELVFTGSFTPSQIKTIDGRRFAYFVVNLKYSEDVMTNTDPNYAFLRNVNQLFASDFHFVLE